METCGREVEGMRREGEGEGEGGREVGEGREEGRRDNGGRVDGWKGGREGVKE